MYTIYKITNTINNKFYIGVHKTDNPMDSYYGSGIVIQDAIKKHGKQNFKKEILFIFDNAIDAYNKEREIVNEDFVNDPNTYNMQVGGIPSIEWTEERKIKASQRLSGINHFSYGKKLSEEHKRKIGLAGLGRKMSRESIERGAAKRKGKPSPVKGRKLTDEDKAKKSLAALAREKLKCPHCDKECDPGNAKKFHFENCKVIKPREIKQIACPHCAIIGTSQVMYRWHFNNCKSRVS